MSAGKPKLYITTNNHFDPTWRRCFRKSLEFGGRRFVSYVDLERYYIDDNLDLAAKHPQYAFEVESPIVLREYLKQRPEKLDDLKKLASEGRFATGGGAGDNIIDANMVLGESIVRNFVHGVLWAEATLGEKSILALRNDGFGNPAQLPQILRGCGLKWVRGISYTPCPKPYWRGLDGSTVSTASLPGVGHLGPTGWMKYPPCPSCSGYGCESCAGRGIEPSLRCSTPADLDEEALQREGVGVVRLSPEELLPSEKMIEWGASYSDKYDVRFATEPSFYEHLARSIEAVDTPPEDDVFEGELNPNNSGCLVTRIRTKQVCRRQEYALLGAETLAVMAHLKGEPYPRDEIVEVLEPLLFTMFHDAVTATHVDAAYGELQEVWADIDRRTASIRDGALEALVEKQQGALSVLNLREAPTSQVVTSAVRVEGEGVSVSDAEGNDVPVLSCARRDDQTSEVSFVATDVGGLSAKAYTFASGAMKAPQKLAKPTIENERFRVDADDNGILAIYDKKLQREIAAAAEYRPGELIVEHDIGSPWATISADRARFPLSGGTTLLSAEAGAGFQRLVFQVPAPRMSTFLNIGGADFRVTCTVYDGIERVDFHVDADWNNYNCRLRIAMPVPQAGSHMYGVPYGMLERRPYEPNFGWAGANGDWPTINWAGVGSGKCSVALLSKGLPSYCIERTGSGSRILLSVLRSPGMPTYLHEPACYVMTDYDGMRDAGAHQFDCALSAYDCVFAESTIARDADAYNAGLLAVEGSAKLPDMPRVESDCVRMNAMKQSEDGAALILRLAEFRGRGGEAKVKLPAGYPKASKTNLLEREAQALPVDGGVCLLTVRPWEIVTLRLEK